MEPIYSQARPTYVWLGHGSQRNYSSIRHLQRVAYRFPLLRYMSLAYALRERATAITKLKLLWIIVKVAAINFAKYQYLYNSTFITSYMTSFDDRCEVLHILFSSLSAYKTMYNTYHTPPLYSIRSRICRFFAQSSQREGLTSSVRYSQSRMVSKSMDFPGNRFIDRGHHGLRLEVLPSGNQLCHCGLESSTNAWWDTLQFGTAHSLVNVWMNPHRMPHLILSDQRRAASTNYSFGALLKDAGIVLDKRPYFLCACLRVSNWIVAFAVSWLPFLKSSTAPICIAYPFADAGSRRGLRITLFAALSVFAPAALYLYGFIRILGSSKGLHISKHTSLFNSFPEQCQPLQTR